MSVSGSYERPFSEVATSSNATRALPGARRPPRGSRRREGWGARLFTFAHLRGRCSRGAPRAVDVLCRAPGTARRFHPAGSSLDVSRHPATRDTRPGDFALRLERTGPFDQDAFDRIDIRRPRTSPLPRELQRRPRASASPAATVLPRQRRGSGCSGLGDPRLHESHRDCVRPISANQTTSTPTCASILSTLRLAASAEDGSFSRRSARPGERLGSLSAFPPNPSGPPALGMPRRRARGSSARCAVDARPRPRPPPGRRA